MAKVNVQALSDDRLKELVREIQDEQAKRGYVDPEIKLARIKESDEYKALVAKHEAALKAQDEAADAVTAANNAFDNAVAACGAAELALVEAEDKAFED